METVRLGCGEVLISIAHNMHDPDKVQCEVLITKAEEPQLVGTPSRSLLGQTLEHDDPRILARLRIEHPDGADVLIEKLEKAAENMARHIEQATEGDDE